MATHSRTLAWKIPWTEEPGRLQSIGSQRVGHHWATSHNCRSPVLQAWPCAPSGELGLSSQVPAWPGLAQVLSSTAVQWALWAPLLLWGYLTKPWTQPSPCYFSSYLIQPFMLVTVTVSWMWEAICEGLIDFPPSFHIYFPSPRLQKHALNQRPWQQQQLMLAESCFYYFFPGNNYLSSLSSDWGHRKDHLFPSAWILSCSSTPRSGPSH